jgi:hypothetical protein
MANDPTPHTRPQDSYDKLAARFHLDPQAFRAALQAGVESGQVQLTAADNATEPALRGLGFVSRIVQSQVPSLHPDGPLALEAVAAALVRRAELRPIRWEHAKARPPIAGLPEAVMDWAALKQEQGQRLGLAPARIDELKHLAVIIQVKRDYHEVARSLMQAFEADLAVDEGRARELLEGDVTPLRAALEQSPELARKAVRVLAYLYGAAQRGAETRADLAAKRKAWTAQTATTAHAAGVDEGARRMGDKLKAVLDGPAPPDPASDPRNPHR